MPVKTELWMVGDQPKSLSEARLATEQQLEAMIVKEPRMLSSEWLLIGRQERTFNNQPLDLLALGPDGSLILIELKRHRTPREVVSQALDYASWVEKLESNEIARIFERFSGGKNLATEFLKKFGTRLDEDTLNQDHQVVIVAAELDESTERIVNYLNDRGLSINVLFFQVFVHGEDQLVSRTWMLDPVATQASGPSPRSKNNEPWNGEYYCSFGEADGARSWAEAREYGFISGGGGAWYSRTLGLLKPGDRIWVNSPGYGYVGVGRVSSEAQPASEFTINTENGPRPALDVLNEGTYHRELVDDEERCEYFVAVDWIDTLPSDKAIQEIGLFGNQNTVCRPTSAKWRSTIDRLKSKFNHLDGL